MTVGDLIRFRRELGLTQADMARTMGIGTRSYSELEAQDADEDLGRRHIMLIERCSLSLAIERRNIMFAMPGIRREARALINLFDTGEAGTIFD